MAPAYGGRAAPYSYGGSDRRPAPASAPSSYGRAAWKPSTYGSGTASSTYSRPSSGGGYGSRSARPAPAPARRPTSAEGARAGAGAAPSSSRRPGAPWRRESSGDTREGNIGGYKRPSGPAPTSARPSGAASRQSGLAPSAKYAPRAPGGARRARPEEAHADEELPEEEVLPEDAGLPDDEALQEEADELDEEPPLYEEEEVPVEEDAPPPADDYAGEEEVFENEEGDLDQGVDEQEPPVDEEEDVAEEPPIDEEEEAAEEHVEPEGEADEDPGEDNVPKREDDLDLEDVPEHMRESVEGNLQLKRVLSKDSVTSASKRPRAGGDANGAAATPTKEKKLDPRRAQLLARWGLRDDAAARYVIGIGEIEAIEEVARSDWRPKRVVSRDGKTRTHAELLAEAILRAKEKSHVDRSALDSLEVFKHRHKLKSDDVARLKDLIHKDLAYVMRTYDGKRTISELVEESSMEPPEDAPTKTDDAAPEKPGVFTIGRRTRLELIDPGADALVCGDANLTFSLLLTQHRKVLGHVGRTVATTFETIDILRERYKEIDETVRELEDNQAEVLHNVDGTRLAVDPRFLGMEEKFGAVYYNFPHAGVVGGFFDNHPFVRWRHENLMSLFFRALRGFVKPGGSVKVSSNMNATGVRFTDILEAAANSEFVHVETIPFMEWCLRGYRRSYGDRRDANRRPDGEEVYRDQRAWNDMVYCFQYAPSGETPPKPRIRYPPTKQDLLSAKEGNLRDLRADAKQRRVEEIYQLFLSYVQGIHIG